MKKILFTTLSLMFLWICSEFILSGIEKQWENPRKIELKTGKDGKKPVFITSKHSIDLGDEGVAKRSAFDSSAQKLFVGMEGVDTVAVYNEINQQEPKYLQMAK